MQRRCEYRVMRTVRKKIESQTEQIYNIVNERITAIATIDVNEQMFFLYLIICGYGTRIKITRLVVQSEIKRYPK